MKRREERELSKLLLAGMGGHENDEIACFDVLACPTAALGYSAVVISIRKLESGQRPLMACKLWRW